jgi:FtsH-binding integral membrane protein
MIGYGALGAIIFSLFIVYDTQLMLGGKHKCAIDPEEYVFAALNLYLDIINLFMYILLIVGASRSD